MRWCLVLVAILGVLVAGIVKVATRERGASARLPPISEPAEGEESGEGAVESSAASARPALRRRVPRPGLPTVENADARRPAIAMLHGHVRLPAGWTNAGRREAQSGDEDAIDLADLTVVATDGVRTLTANADREGRFAFHLPPGAYTLSVSTGDWTAIRTDVLARSATDREVDLQLARGATIAGRLRRSSTDGPVWISAQPTGVRAAAAATARATVGEDDQFTVRGLIPGRRYDLTVSGDDVRTVRLPDVMAPAAGLDVSVGPRPTVRGAIGVPAGEPCPIEEVALRAAARDPATAGAGQMGQLGEAGEADTSQAPDGACAFDLSVPDGVTQATIVATGSGWHLEEPVEIPAAGDPPPVCLNPPCANPDDVAADVVVEVSGPGHVGGLVVCLSSTERGISDSCLAEETGGRYLFKRRLIGATLIVWVPRTGCIPGQQTIRVQRGHNLVGLACHGEAAGPDHDS